MLTPDFFFNLESFFHKQVFLENKPIWETLKNLQGYFEKFFNKNSGNIDCYIPPSTTLVNSNYISIGKGTVIEPQSYIEGPCIIGQNCSVRHGSYIRPYVITGNNCVIGHCSEIKHSILLNKAKAPHFNYVGDSILGNSVNIGAGVVCANFRLDQAEIIIKKLETGMKKLGAIIGDLSQIGCNSVINPGVLIEKKSFFPPCSYIKKANPNFKR